MLESYCTINAVRLDFSKAKKLCRISGLGRVNICRFGNVPQLERTVQYCPFHEKLRLSVGRPLTTPLTRQSAVCVTFRSERMPGSTGARNRSMRAASLFHGPPDDVVGARRSAGGCDHDSGRVRPQQLQHASMPINARTLCARTPRLVLPLPDWRRDAVSSPPADSQRPPLYGLRTYRAPPSWAAALPAAPLAAALKSAQNSHFRLALSPPHEQ